MPTPQVPSAYYRFDDKTGKTLMLQVFALRDIKTEKEILFNVCLLLIIDTQF